MPLDGPLNSFLAGMALGCIWGQLMALEAPWWCCVPSGSGWTAVFEPVSSKPPTPCVAMDVGSSVWDSAAPENAAPEKGWAKFTDFQPFCW